MDSNVTITENDILCRVAITLNEFLDIPQDKINGQSRLIDDLGADSLDAVEVVMALEDEFKVNLGDVGKDDIYTVNDIVKYVGAKLAGRNMSSMTGNT